MRGAVLITHLSSFIDLKLIASRISGVYPALGIRLHVRNASPPQPHPPRKGEMCCLYCYCLSVVSQFTRVGSEALPPREGYFKKEAVRELQDAAEAIYRPL